MPFPGQRKVPLSGGLATTVPSGVIFSRSGNISNAYLQIGSVISSSTGFPVRVNDSSLSFISVQNELANTFSVTIYEWNGTAETALATINVTSALGADYTPPTPVTLTYGTSLRAKVSSGSCKNPVVLVYLVGDVPA